MSDAPREPGHPVLETARQSGDPPRRSSRARPSRVSPTLLLAVVLASPLACGRYGPPVRPPAAPGSAAPAADPGEFQGLPQQIAPDRNQGGLGDLGYLADEFDDVGPGAPGDDDLAEGEASADAAKEKEDATAPGKATEPGSQEAGENDGE